MATRTQLRKRLIGAALAGLLLLIQGAWSPADAAQDRGKDKPRPVTTQGTGGDRGGGHGSKDKGKGDSARGGAKDRAKSDGAKGHDKDRPAGDRDRDRPAGGEHDTARDRPPQKDEAKKDEAKKDAVRDRVTDKPSDRPADRPAEKVTEKPSDRPSDKPRGSDRAAERGGDRPPEHAADQARGEVAPLTDTDRAHTKQIQRLERSHRLRMARLERLRAVYGEEGNEEKLAELEKLRHRQVKLYTGRLAKHEKDLGPDKYHRVLKDIPAAKRPRPVDQPVPVADEERKPR